MGDTQSNLVVETLAVEDGSQVLCALGSVRQAAIRWDAVSGLRTNSKNAQHTHRFITHRYMTTHPHTTHTHTHTHSTGNVMP